jgi:hypothetical protein
MWHIQTGFDDAFNDGLLEEITEVADNFNEDSEVSSLLDCNKLHINALVTLKKKIIEDALNKYMPGNQEAVFEPSKSWVNVNIPGERIELHAHPDASIACTYYIQGPDQGGDFYYVDTGKVGEHKTQIKRITPKTGDLIFFPSYVLHGIEVNEGRARINLTTSFVHSFTQSSQDQFTLKSYINSMKRIKSL